MNHNQTNQTTSRLRLPLLLVALLFLGLVGGPATPAAAADQGGVPLAQFLNANGTLNLPPEGVLGSINLAGYEMVNAPGAAPRFAATADDNWIAGFHQPGMSGNVRALAWDGSNLYAGGSFTSADGVADTAYIARWDGSSWHPLGSGMNNTVYALAWDGSNLYAGGLFTSAGGVANTSYIARWHGNNWHPLGSGMNSTVSALAWDGSNLYAGGWFNSAGGVADTKYIASWDGSSWHPLGSGMSSGVNALAWDGSNNTLYAGGQFGSASGVPNTKSIARWHDNSWHPLGSGMDDTVNALAWDGNNDTLYAGGKFTNAGGVANTNYIARWDGNSWHSLGNGMNFDVNALAWDGSNLYAGGGFSSAGGVPNTKHIAHWDGNSWHALGSGMSGGDTVIALAWDGSNLYAGGQFNSAGDVADTKHIASWDGSSWQPLSDGSGSGMSSTVNALAWDGSDLYAGGSFTSAGGVAASRIARWDGSSWHSLGSGMNSTVNALAWDGSNLYAGGSFTSASGVANTSRIARWDGSSWHSLGSGMNNTLYALAWDGSDLYAGGNFSSAGGVAANRIARWDGSSWHPLGSGISGTVGALAWDGSNLYAGGGFSSAGGVANTNRIARWDGSSWYPLGSGIGKESLSSSVSALAWNGENLYVGGSFYSAGGVTNTAYIARWDGSSWHSFGSGVSSSVSALAWDGSNLYVGGGFTSAGGVAASRIARWDGSSWHPLGSGMNNQVNALAWDGSSLYAGGGFTTAGQTASSYIAQWHNSVSSPEAAAGGPYAVAEGSSTPLDASATTDPNQDASTLTYEWDFDGDGSYDDATGITPSFSAATLDGPSSVTIGLKVSNDAGGSDTTTATVNVSNVAPTISSVTNDGPVDEGNSVTISVTASDVAGAADPLNYEFDCDNNGSYEVGPQASSSTSCTLSSSGSVNVRVTDGDSGEATDATTVTVNNLDPTISSVSSNLGTVAEGGSVTITVSASDADDLSYEFDCDNDGDYEVGPQASSSTDCTVGNNGTAQINVRVTDGDGGEATDSTSVTVINANPTINSVSNDGPIDEGHNATITVDASDVDALSYEFDCDDDNNYEVGPQASSSTSCFFSDQTDGGADGFGPDPATPAGRVNVRVTDGDGGEATDYTFVTVNNVDPTISSVSNGGPVDEFGSVTISVTASDPAGTADTLSYEFDCDNNGSYEVGPQAESSTSCTMGDNGSTQVNVRVRDEDGGETTDSTTVTVNNVAPTISSVTNDGPVDEGNSVTISLTASDVAGAADPLRYAFDCDSDGSYEVGPQAASSTSCTLSSSGGVNVYVSDDDGGYAFSSTAITVNNLDPVINSVSNDGPINEGNSVTISVDASDVDTLSYEFDCDGDGNYEVEPQAESSTSCYFGDQTEGELLGANLAPVTLSGRVNVRVTDGDGGEATDSTTVTVNNVNPTISSVSNDGPIDEGNNVTITVTASDPAGANDPLSYEFDCDGDGDYEVGPQSENSTSCFFSDQTGGEPGGAPLAPATLSGRVNVRVTDGDGGEATDYTYVSVNNADPTISSVSNGGPVDEFGSVTISVTASDPAGTADTLSYEFDCDNDNSYEVGPQASSSTSCTMGDNGSTQVNVRVRDEDGGETTDSTTVTVNNVAPTISSVTNDGPVDEGSSVTISVTASDVAGKDDPLSYEFDCDNDGDYEVGPQTSSSTSCTAGGNDSQVNVRVTDGDGGEATDATTVSVNNLNPTISSVTNAGPVDEGGSVTISVDASDVDTLSYEFDCDGDGDYEVGPQASSSTSCTVGGSNSQINVRVTDGDGGEATDSTTVTVNNLDPVIHSVSNDGPVLAGDAATITVNASDADPLRYAFDCDNNGSYEIGPQASRSTTCTYTEVGEHSVQVRVTDGDGGEANEQTVVVVYNYPATCDVTAEYVNVIHGTDRNDKLTGTPDNDIIFGYGGNDRIEGMGGNDCLIGGPGNDQLFGDEGSDILWGGEVDNGTVYPSKDRDRLYGGDGNDELHGGGDKDRLDGDDGDDTLYGDDGDDTMVGHDGDDTMYGGSGRDNMRGDDGHDRMYGEAGNDRLYGRQGDDLLDGGDDVDQLDGSAGTDTCVAGEKLKSCETDAQPLSSSVNLVDIDLRHED